MKKARKNITFKSEKGNGYSIIYFSFLSAHETILALDISDIRICSLRKSSSDLISSIFRFASVLFLLNSFSASAVSYSNAMLAPFLCFTLIYQKI